jgi:hypothetical protein
MKILLRTRGAATTSASVTVRPSALVIRSRPLRVLDFDTEARPLSFLGSDFVTKEITAMAWAWTDAPDDVTCHLLEPESDGREMLRAFLDAYSRADLVTGHFILGYDLPTINGALMEYRLPLLPNKMAHDTKCHLAKRAGISVSQESLGAMLRIEHKKVQMNQGLWREANRLTPEGRLLTRERVVGDVRQHMAMRRELDALGYLAPAKMWKSGSARTEEYVP